MCYLISIFLDENLKENQNAASIGNINHLSNFNKDPSNQKEIKNLANVKKSSNNFEEFIKNSISSKKDLIIQGQGENKGTYI